MIAPVGFSQRPKWLADLAGVTAVGVFLGLLGPFGSFSNGPAWQRVEYWTAIAWLGFGFAFGARALLERLRIRRGRSWTGLGAYVVLASAILGVASWLLAGAIWPELHLAPGPPAHVWFLRTLTITAGYVALFTALRWSRRGLEPAPAPPVAAARLPAAPRQVLCLQMEDHYVRVHTATGSRLVLATMAQAVAAVAQVPGLRVHRSWWVAQDAVADVQADGRNLRLALTNGAVAPVSRSRVSALRQAGWLDRGPAGRAAAAED